MWSIARLVVESPARRTESTAPWRLGARRGGTGALAMLLAALHVLGGGTARGQVEGPAGPPDSGTSITVTYDGSMTDPPTESFSGRVYVVFGAPDDVEPRMRILVGQETPVLSHRVTDWKPGEPLVFDERTPGHPTKLPGIEPGTYNIQAVMRRNLDSPNIGAAPGNAYSPVMRGPVGEPGVPLPSFVIDATQAPREPELDRISRMMISEDRVEFLEMRSRELSAFHGRDVVMRAAIVLPEGYDDGPADERMPMLAIIPGYGQGYLQGVAMAAMMRSPVADEVIKVVLDPLCFHGHHAFVDSPTNGPWSTALRTELIPLLESSYRFQGDGTGRFLVGITAGGWAALWLQTNHPTFFSGAWAAVPDPVDFRDFFGVNLYESPSNFLYNTNGTERAMARLRDGTELTFADLAAREAVLGPGGQIGAFEAAFSPVEDGEPAPIFDRRTGEVDLDTAAAWYRYDLRRAISEAWLEHGDVLAGKLHVYVGDRDNYGLDGPAMRLRREMESLGHDVEVVVMPDRDHNGVPSARLFEQIEAEAHAMYRASRKKGEPSR